MKEIPLQVYTVFVDGRKLEEFQRKVDEKLEELQLPYEGERLTAGIIFWGEILDVKVVIDQGYYLATVTYKRWKKTT